MLKILFFTSWGLLAQAQEQPKTAETTAIAPSQASNTTVTQLPQLINAPIPAATTLPAEVPAYKLTIGAGKGLNVESSDGQFGITLRMRGQLRMTVIDPNEGDVRHAFEIRRMRLVFGGHVFGPNTTFLVELGFAPQELRNPYDDTPKNILRNFFFEFKHLRDFTVRAGQYKVPFSRERVASSAEMQMADRSISNAEFSLDRDVGFDIRSMDFLGLNRLRYYAGAYLGQGRDAFRSSNISGMFVGRIEYLPLGLFNDYTSADFDRSKNVKLSFGLAYGYVNRAQRNRGILGQLPADRGTTNYHITTADAVLRYAGLSIESAIYWRTGTRHEGTAMDANNQRIAAEPVRRGYGGYIQAGYFPMAKLPIEFTTRYGALRGYGNTSLTATYISGAAIPMNEVGAGINYYLAQHLYKVQLDYFRLAANNNFSNGDNQVRLQVQAMF